MNDDETLTQKMLKQMMSRAESIPHTMTPFGMGFMPQNEQDAERLGLLQELLDKRQEEKRQEHLIYDYYNAVHGWYRWLIADTTYSIWQPLPRHNRYRFEPAWLQRHVERFCGSANYQSIALEPACGIPCPFENFGSSDLAAAKAIVFAQEANSIAKTKSNIDKANAVLRSGTGKA